MADIFQKSVGKCKQFFKRRYTLELPEDWLNQCVEFALETIEEQGVIFKKIGFQLIKI
jgi:hypothetical protein